MSPAGQRVPALGRTSLGRLVACPLLHPAVSVFDPTSAVEAISLGTISLAHEQA
jgi:hypothetical protein